MDEILVKYVIGEATPGEEEQVAAWLKENNTNEKYLAHFRLIWETSKTLEAESLLDEETAWLEFVQLRDSIQPDKMLYPDKEPVQPVYQKEKREGSSQWMQMAAVWMLISGLAVLLYTQLYPAKPEWLTLQSYDTVKIDTLSDGSVITLNKNSVALYLDKFIGNTREMKLVSGEAFFDIAHNPEKPFIVHVNDAKVSVLGTSFNIRNNEDKAEVIVETGIVEVSRKNVIVKLRPAEKADINYHTDELNKGVATDQFYNYFRTKEFVANKTPLWRIVQVLNDVYKVDIRIPDQALANRQLTTTLRLGSLDPILDVLALAFNARILHETDHIIIRY
jgi:transmembrane sensor